MQAVRYFVCDGGISWPRVSDARGSDQFTGDGF